MNRFYTIYLPGAAAMKSALEYIGPRCYRVITDTAGKYIGQIENVIDEPGNELTVIPYIRTLENVKTIINHLRENGFSNLFYDVLSYRDSECIFDEKQEYNGTI